MAYGVEVVEPFGRGRDGLVKVTVAKDRPGHVRRHADDSHRIADMRLMSDPDDGSVSIQLVAPGGEPAWRPTVLMHRIAGAVAAEPGLTVNGIRDGVKGNNSYKQEALRLLISEGFVERREEGAAKRHYPLRPFTEESTAPTAPKAAPNRAQAHSTPPAPRAPLPVGGAVRGASVEDHPSETSPRPTLEVVPSTACTCPRPARSPRGEGPPVCAKCHKPVVEVAA